MAFDVTTQWDDIHRKLGNYEELPVEKKQSEFTKENVGKMENFDALDHKDDDELDDLEDEFDDGFLEAYKRKKMAEVEMKQMGPKYGTVREITRQDYIDQVTEAEKGTYVILLLYQSWVEVSVLACNLLHELAAKYPNHKFLKIVADKCIENYPDAHVPTLIIYKDGINQKTIARFDKNYRKLTVASFEDQLQEIGIIPKPEKANIEEAQQYKSKLDFANFQNWHTARELLNGRIALIVMKMRGKTRASLPIK